VSTYQKDWVEVRSQHFVVKSALDQDKAKRLAEDLERFRQVVATMTTSGELEEPPIPTRIFVFDRASYREFRPGRHIAGFFMAGLRANWIVLSEGQFLDAQDTIQHEYTHYVLHNIGGATYPRWYDEGLAEFLSTVRQENGNVYVGAPSPMQLGMLRSAPWIPIARLIDPDPKRKLNEGQFYGESWALVHYLVFGRDEHKAGEMARYLTALEARVEPAIAFEQAFGLTTEQADERMQIYVRAGMAAIAWPEDKFVKPSDISARAIAPSEIAIDLGELALRCSTNDADLSERAEDYFRAALPHARAYAGLGSALAARGKLEDAERSLQKAVELDPNDPQLELNFGGYCARRASDATTREESARWLAEARKHYIRAWKMDPDIAEAYAGYGMTFTFKGEDAAKGLQTLEHASELIPSNLDLRLGLAQLYLKLHRNADARTLLLTVVAWMHPDDPNTKAVNELLALAEAPLRDPKP
jgi:cytochrome c-type biogenesis protein CcmH/NrfG